MKGLRCWILISLRLKNRSCKKEWKPVKILRSEVLWHSKCSKHIFDRLLSWVSLLPETDNKIGAKENKYMLYSYLLEFWLLRIEINDNIIIIWHHPVLISVRTTWRYDSNNFTYVFFLLKIILFVINLVLQIFNFDYFVVL